jgi:hypothetical protein
MFEQAQPREGRWIGTRLSQIASDREALAALGRTNNLTVRQSITFAITKRACLGQQSVGSSITLYGHEEFAVSGTSSNLAARPD